MLSWTLLYAFDGLASMVFRRTSEGAVPLIFRAAVRGGHPKPVRIECSVGEMVFGTVP